MAVSYTTNPFFKLALVPVLIQMEPSTTFAEDYSPDTIDILGSQKEDSHSVEDIQFAVLHSPQ
jgi:hypothetical protein